MIIFLKKMYVRTCMYVGKKRHYTLFRIKNILRNFVKSKKKKTLIKN